MALEMRHECERCFSPTMEDSIAYICVYECTFCEPCTNELQNICPNCGGELVRRPREQQSACNLTSK